MASVDQRRGGLAQEIETGAHHLRLAAQAIGVLDPFVAGEMRSANGASREQGAQRRGDLDLAAMAASARGCARRTAYPIRARRRSTSAPVANAERNSVSASNRPTSALAVENCVPLSSASPSLGRSAIGSRPASASAAAAGAMRPPRRTSPTPIIAAAIWASGARSPDAPTDPCAGTTGVNAASEHRLDEAKRPRLDARGALGEAAELQRHHQPRRRDRGGFADAGRVRQDDVALKLREIGRLDAHAGEFAEAGVDAVDRLAAGEDPLDRGGARGHAGVMGRVDGDRRAAPDRPPVGKRRLAGAENDGH